MGIKQIIIAAGGIGSRMSQEVNRKRSKSLIEYRGRPLIYYLLQSAKEAGLRKFLVSVNKQNRDIIKEIMEEMNIPHELKLTSDSFKRVPTLFQGLDKKVILACGHHFIPPSHFKSLIKQGEIFDVVFSAYSSPPHISDKTNRILVYNLNNPKKIRFEYMNLPELNFPTHHAYVRNPYVVTSALIDKVASTQFQHYLSFFAYQHWVEGGKVTAIKAPMPPEFDYDPEFKRTKKGMDKFFRARMVKGS